MMNFLAVVNRGNLLFSFVCFFLLEAHESRCQVSRIDVDEASDIVYNNCSENQFSVFVFRYPGIGELESRYASILERFSAQSSVYMVDIRMEPIPGCSRPKVFDLCGYLNLNAYMKYKPFLGFISTTGNRWVDFQASAHYTTNKSFFLTVTDKDGNRAPFVNVTTFEGFEIILDYLNNRSVKNYALKADGPKVNEPAVPIMDSVKVFRWINSVFDARKPVEKSISGYLGLKTSGFWGSLASSGSTPSNEANILILEAQGPTVRGHGISLFYERPLVLPSLSIKLAQRFEVGSQSLNYDIVAQNGAVKFNKIINGTNLFFSYFVISDYPLARNLNFVLGAGGSVVGRLPYNYIQSSGDWSETAIDDKIESFDLCFALNGGIRHSFNSHLSAFIDLGYNLGLRNFDKVDPKAGTNTLEYNLQMLSISAGLLFPIR